MHIQNAVFGPHLQTSPDSFLQLFTNMLQPLPFWAPGTQSPKHSQVLGFPKA